jgi:hypothetical protein
MIAEATIVPLETLEDGRAFTVESMPPRLAKLGDLWAGLLG